jgi:hypothetical protein
MKFFLFKLFLKISSWFAPDKKIFQQYIASQSSFIECQKRQKERDRCVRPRTETHEWLTCKKQRELYLKGKPIRGQTRNTRRDYTDYDEAQAYHEKGL